MLVPQPFELHNNLIILPDPLVDYEQDRIEWENNAKDESQDFDFHECVLQISGRDLTLLGALPPPRGHPPVAMPLYYLYE